MNNPTNQFDPRTLHGISFYDIGTDSEMRYIYPDAGHWCADWIVRRTHGGQWETYRKPTPGDYEVIEKLELELKNAQRS